MTYQSQNKRIRPWACLQQKGRRDNPITRKSTFHLQQKNVAVEGIRWIVNIAFYLCLVTSSWAQSLDIIEPMVQLKIQPTSIPPLGSLEVQITRPVGSNADRYFVNVFMDINMDGQIGSVFEPGLEEWVVRNYPVELPEAELTTVIPPPFHYGMGAYIPDLKEMQISVSAFPITEFDVADGADDLNNIANRHLIELPTNQGQPLPIVMMKCPKQIDFSGEEQVEFSCTLTNTNGNPIDVEYFLHRLTSGALVEGAAVIAERVSIGESLLNDVETSLEASVTIPFMATRTDKQLPSDWTYRARVADTTTNISSTGITIDIGDSVGDLRFVDNLVKDAVGESTLLLTENDFLKPYMATSAITLNWRSETLSKDSEQKISTQDDDDNEPQPPPLDLLKGAIDNEWSDELQYGCEMGEGSIFLCNDDDKKIGGIKTIGDEPVEPVPVIKVGKKKLETAVNGNCVLPVYISLDFPHRTGGFSRSRPISYYEHTAVSVGPDRWIRGRFRLRKHKIKDGKHIGKKFGRFPGTLTLEWKRGDGSLVTPLDIDSKPVVHEFVKDNRIVISANDSEVINKAFKKLNLLMPGNIPQSGFVIKPLQGARPGMPQKEIISMTVEWKEDPKKKDAETCTKSLSAKIQWIARKPMPPHNGNPDKGSGAGTPLRLHAIHTYPPAPLKADNELAVVTPMELFWPVPDFKKCCNKDCKTKIIQFARAAVKTQDPRLRMGKPWSLDILESEKEKARKKSLFDPTFTGMPFVKNTEKKTPETKGTPRTFQGKKAKNSVNNDALVQWDAPGFSDFVYDQLLELSTPSTFYQQFIALLVCQQEKHWDAASYIKYAKVKNALFYTITWQFPGKGQTPKVTVSNNSIRDLSCENLGGILSEIFNNKELKVAFNNPPKSQLDYFSKMEMGQLVDDIEARLKAEEPLKKSKSAK